MNRYRSELVAVALILGIALISALGVVMVSADAGAPLARPAPAPTARVVRPTPVPSVVAGPLDGMPTARRLAQRRPLAVLIDNFYPDARPESGIANASVVFEALTEGGITRLMALFLERDARRVGPIRSARSYFVDWAAGFRAMFVHAGGAPSALTLLHRTPSLVDIEALAPTSVFSRERDRATPHDLYGSTSGARGLARASTATSGIPAPGLSFRPPAPLRARGHASAFQVSFSTPQVPSPAAYAVTYRYARQRNLYLRSQGGVPFRDRATGAQVAASNVIVMYARVTLVPNDPVGRVVVTATGGGRAILFQNGHTIGGKWSKVSSQSPLVLTRSSGAPMTLTPGQTWIEVTSPGGMSTARTS